MSDDEHICQKCARKISGDETYFHAVRSGYSPVHFPLFHFEKVPLCGECRNRQQKIDLFEKVLAVVALGLVAYFMIMGFLFLFGLRN